MTKVFLDLGTNMFQGLEEFTYKLGIDTQWIIYSYEASPSIYEKSIEIKKKIEKNYNKLIHINKAVYNSNGHIILNNHYGSTLNGQFIEDYNGGSNILDENPLIDPVNGAIFHIKQEEIECIDINDIIEEIFNSHGKSIDLYIKCDIEGSEFKVLPKLLLSNHLSNIKEMYIEWHERFFLKTSEYNTICNLKKDIISKILMNNIKYFEHH